MDLIICKKMIEDALMANVIRPCVIMGELAAKVGDNWFWFGGEEYKFQRPEDIQFGRLVELLKDALDEFEKQFPDEYQYYYWYMFENT